MKGSRCPKERGLTQPMRQQVLRIQYAIIEATIANYSATELADLIQVGGPERR